jgi:hypothetical protein
VRIELINSLDANPLSERLRGLDTVSTVEATARHDALLVLAKPGMNPFTEIGGIAAREAWPIKGIHRQGVRLDGVFKALTQTDRSL